MQECLNTTHNQHCSCAWLLQSSCTNERCPLERRYGLPDPRISLIYDIRQQSETNVSAQLVARYKNQKSIMQGVCDILIPTTTLIFYNVFFQICSKPQSIFYHVVIVTSIHPIPVLPKVDSVSQQTNQGFSIGICRIRFCNLLRIIGYNCF